MACEHPGGSEREPEVNATTIGCARYTPNNGQYSIMDYYTPVYDANTTNLTWSPLPFGRALPSTSCVSPYRTEMGRTGLYRLVLTFYYAMLPPLAVLVVAKIICRLCLRMPWMAKTRKRNAKLQRTAAKRKAEVRRMTEGGQEFAVKRAARITGQADTVNDVLASMAKSSETDESKEKKTQAGSALLGKLKSRTSLVEGTPEASEAGDAASGEKPLAIKGPDAAPAAAPAAAAPAPAAAKPASFAQQLKALTEEAEES